MGAVALPLAMAAVGVGGGLKAYSSWQQGQQASRAASIQAEQMRQKASADMGIAQRRAIEERRQAGLVSSSALARSAGFGGGYADPTTQSIIGDITERGEYNALSQLYSGKSAYQTGMYGADVADWQGKNARRAGNIGAFTSVLTTAASMYGMSGGFGGAGGAGSYTPPPGGSALYPGGTGVGSNVVPVSSFRFGG